MPAAGVWGILASVGGLRVPIPRFCRRSRSRHRRRIAVVIRSAFTVDLAVVIVVVVVAVALLAPQRLRIPAAARRISAVTANATAKRSARRSHLLQPERDRLVVFGALHAAAAALDQ